MIVYEETVNNLLDYIISNGFCLCYIFVVNAYVSIKYEVETIDNDAIINMVYQIFDTGVTINFIWFAINTIIILGLYIKLRRK